MDKRFSGSHQVVTDGAHQVVTTGAHQVVSAGAHPLSLDTSCTSVADIHKHMFVCLYTILHHPTIVHEYVNIIAYMYIDADAYCVWLVVGASSVLIAAAWVP